VDWKPERAVQAKIRGIKRNILPVDWKPEKAVQAKVRDFQRKIKQKAWLLKHTNRGILCVGLHMVTSSRLLVEQWIFSPGGISSYLIPDFTPSAARFIPNDTISKGVCRVLVLRCRSTSQLTCLVSFHQSYTVILSYSPTSCTFIQSYVRTSYIHTFIHSYNHTFIH